jgi:hypothetical protein
MTSWFLQIELFKNDNYTVYKNADWLIAVIFFLQIQGLHCDFAEFLLHVGVFA